MSAEVSTAERTCRIFSLRGSDMLDLLNPTYCQIITSTPTYDEDGYMSVLLLRVKNRETLRLTNDGEDYADLDNTLVWKQKKVCQKAVQLLSGIDKGELDSKILQIAFLTLKRDEEFTTGIKGNLVTEFLAHGYKIGTAKAQANQIFTLFRLLKITELETPHRYNLNPCSLVYEKAMKLF